MGNNTIEKWQEYSKKINIKELIKSVENIPYFQKWLAEIINSKYKKNYEIIEIWCEFWTTSLILNDDFNKTLLDFDNIALEKAKSLFSHYWKNADFTNQDMFNMNFWNKKFDIVFNAWVLEHFNFSERVILLKKYTEILKEDWIMIIAVPNHYNILYKIAYILLNLIWKWSFPKENKIYDLSKEIEKSWLKLISRKTIDRENIFTIWWSFWNILRKLFLPTMKEWYLTILEIKKL